MNQDNLTLSAFAKNDILLAYPKFKEALYDVSQAAFGWDEGFQHERFDKAYRPEWFYWIQQGSERIGYVCYKTDKAELHLHLLIIFNEYQRQGFGKKAMSLIHDVAKKLNVDVTLSSLKNNTGAVKLYKKLGYEICKQEDYFYDMILKKTQL